MLRIASIGLLLAPPLAAQVIPRADGERPPKRVVGAPAEFQAPFSLIRAVMALPDGRLIVSDPVENRIVLLDFAKGTSRDLSRTGGGPQEYRRVGGLYRALGGGVLIFDQGLRRLLPVSAAGEVDPLACPRCQGLMRIVAVITDPAVITRILAHRARARDSPQRSRSPPPRRRRSPTPTAAGHPHQ